jgi:O-antigen/teichoic acid export membrane protein
MKATLTSVFKHSLVYAIGDIVGKCIGFILIPVYTHYLSTGEYGVLELLELTTYIVALLLAMGLGQSVVRFYYDFESKTDRDTVVSVAILSLSALSIVSFLILWFLAPSISTLVFGDSERSSLFQLVFVGMAFSVVNEVPLQLIKIEKKSVLFVAISLLRLLLSLSLNILFLVYLHMGVFGVVLSGVLTSAVLFAVLFTYFLRSVTLRWSTPLLKNMLTYGFGLVGNWLGMFLLHFSDRFILQRVTSLDEVGVYSLAYRFGLVINFLLLSPFLNIWTPKQFEVSKEKDGENIFGHIVTYYVVAQVGVSVGIACVINDVIFLISGAEYHQASKYVPLILLGYNFYGLYQLGQFGLLFAKKTKLLGFLTLVASAVSLLGTYVLASKLGAWGASLSTALSFFLLWVLVVGQAQKHFRISYQHIRLVKIFALGIIVWTISQVIPLERGYQSLVVTFFIGLIYPALVFLLVLDARERSTVVSIIKNPMSLRLG